jgi:hypothetical protein
MVTAMRRLLLCILLLTPMPGVGDDFRPQSTNDGQLIMRGIPEIPDNLVARIRQYQDVRSATLLDWTRDGGGLYISTRFGDINQVHRVRKAGGTITRMNWSSPWTRVAVSGIKYFCSMPAAPPPGN